MALSVADDDLDSVHQASVWPTGHRPTPTRGRAVAAVRRPWPHRSGREVPKSPRYAGAASIPSPSLFHLQSGETEPPLPPLLRRAHARSPPHHYPPNLAHYSTLDPSTSSTSYLSQSQGGKAALPNPPPSASDVSRCSTTVSWPYSSSISPSPFSSVLSLP
jgi:hypothetical protein